MLDTHDQAAEARAQMSRGPDLRTPETATRDTQIILLEGSIGGIKAALLEIARAVDRLSARDG